MAEPNDGFMAQLELYKEMGCPRDIDAQPKYQRWLYQREVDLALAAGMAPDRVRFEDEEVQEESQSSEKETELRCRKCRYVPLFTDFYPNPFSSSHHASKLLPRTSGLEGFIFLFEQRLTGANIGEH